LFNEWSSRVTLRFIKELQGVLFDSASEPGILKIAGASDV